MLGVCLNLKFQTSRAHSFLFKKWEGINQTVLTGLVTIFGWEVQGIGSCLWMGMDCALTICCIYSFDSVSSDAVDPALSLQGSCRGNDNIYQSGKVGQDL